MIRPVEASHSTPRTPDRDRETVIGNGTGKSSETEEPAQRALVPVSDSQPRPDIQASLRQSRPSAPFLAHLLATEAGDPQTRTRRQLSANETAARYAEAIARPAATKIRSTRDIKI